MTAKELDNLIERIQSINSSTFQNNPIVIGGRVTEIPQTGYANGETGVVHITPENQVIVKPYGASLEDWQYSAPVAGLVNSATAVVVKAAETGLSNYVTGIVFNADTVATASTLAIITEDLAATAAIASNVITFTAAHGLKVGQAVKFTTVTGVTGISANDILYVQSTPTSTTATFSTTVGGNAATISGATPTIAAHQVLWQIKLNTTAGAFLNPSTISFATPLKGATGKALRIQTTTATNSGVWVNLTGYTGL